MRIIQSQNPRALSLLAAGPGGLVAASCDTIGIGGTVEVWTVTTGGVQHRASVSNREARGLAFTPDGRFLFAAEPKAILALDLDEQRARHGPPPVLQYPEFALCAAGRRLLVTEALGNRGRVALFAVGVGPTFHRLWTEGPRDDSWFKIPAISPDGSCVAVARRGSSLGGEEVEVRDADTGTVVASIPSDPADLALQLAFTTDGSKLLVRRSGRSVRVYDPAAGELVRELLHPGQSTVTAIAVHPRGPVACARADGTITFWDAESGEQLRTLDWKAGKLVSVAFSPDGDLGAAGTDEGRVIVWDVDL